ncbi:efflux RND transporter periplasmic adaptor subunit [Propionispora hippei]|uniref:RND family efflux transporter, MFP subunit n=1 Tax=Propionispora hippei DSM 15287 TaxID=1123003 RepID=A0A1M6EZ41_9FIRM|nr:efflux RND transporter periplasmic adaptor subunit [Propionispora hippei]SHI90661.1 RND family efflux transporter, MFP subunit [Propionispora hippei DSM 15287]
MKIAIRQNQPVLVGGLLLLVLAALIAVSYHLFPLLRWARHQFQLPQSPAAVTAVAAGVVDKPYRLVRTGSLEQAQLLPVYTEYAGTVARLYVVPGQAVKTGQPLLTLEAVTAPPVVQPAQPSAGLPASRASYENAQQEFDRYQKLYDLGAISRKQLEAAAARLKAARESQGSAPAASGSTTQSVAAVPRGPVEVKAPADGIVTGLMTAQGKNVPSGQQLMSLGSGQELEAVISLEQSDLYVCRLGTAVTLQLGEQTVPGQVAGIYPEVGEDQSVTYRAHIKLTGQPAGLVPGMAVQMILETGQTVPVLAVPSAALQQDDTGSCFVYTVTDNTVGTQPVSIGETVGDFTEITAGLLPDTLVLRGAVGGLYPGATVVLQ